jgi:hypothetical protein
MPGIADLAGAAAGATPWGAAIGAAGQVLSSALSEPPTNTTSGAGGYQGGSLTIGSRQVGGKGNSAGATTASASQTPLSESPGANVFAGGNSGNSMTVWIIAGAAVVIALIFAFGRRK